MLLLFQETITLTNLVVALLGSSVLGSIIGSVITLIGIGRQNQAHSTRQQEQFEFQAAQTKTEREMAMRREIYLQGVEALGKMQAYLSSFSNPLLQPDEQAKIVNGVNESINKADVISSLEMLQKLDIVQAHYSQSISKLVTMRLDYQTKALQLKSDEDAHLRLAQDRAQLTAELNAAVQRQDRNSQNSLIARYRELSEIFDREELELQERRVAVLRETLEIVTVATEAALCRLSRAS